MSAVSEIITTDQIHDLWGCGFTILPRLRHPDPFFVPQEIVPQGRSYQWWHLVHDKFYFDPTAGGPSGAAGWAPVPASRHDGYFMLFGHTGDIEVNGLGLFEKSKFEVDQELTANIAAAHKQVEDWAAKVGGAGLSGEVKIYGQDEIATPVGGGEAVLDLFVTLDGNVLEVTTRVPKDMLPHMSAIFAERDRLKDEIVQLDRSLKPGEIADKFYAAVEADKSLPWWPTLHAILLPIAIENVRKSLNPESTS